MLEIFQTIESALQETNFKVSFNFLFETSAYDFFVFE